MRPFQSIEVTAMRFLFFLLLSGFSLAAFAHAPDAAPDDVPEVTITKETEQTVEEYRIGGKLYMIKITPKHGVPYYLVDDLGDGKFVRQESLDSGLRVPRWIIHKF